jgi:hypothetical protein
MRVSVIQPEEIKHARAFAAEWAKKETVEKVEIVNLYGKRVGSIDKTDA